MIGTIVNVLLVLLGSVLGLLLRGRLSQTLALSLTRVLALCVMVLGLRSAIGTNDVLCVILCMVIGTLLGELLHIEDRLDRAGEWLRKALSRGEKSGRFTEGFVSATVLFCVGSMSIMGSIEAGLNHNYTILFSKSVLDGVASITFAASLGIGVACSALPLLLYQGGLTLLAAAIGPFLASQASAVHELSAVGGVIILGIGFNLLQLSDRKLPVGNLLPAVFLPFLYIPLADWLSSLLPV